MAHPFNRYYKARLAGATAAEGGLWVDAPPPAISPPAEQQRGRQGGQLWTPVPGVKPACHAPAMRMQQFE